MIPAQVIALFLKAPIAGQVKTRLARDIGDQAACELYCRLVDHAIDGSLASSIPLVICHDGRREELPDGWLQRACEVLPQTGLDLGQRMANAFCDLFTEGAEQVVLIGSDIPGIDATYLRNGFEQLGNSDLVIGPAVDGGYCLIGFNRQAFNPGLFEQIPWSTGQVLELTLVAAENAGLSVALLSTLRDIDTLEDLRALNREYGGTKPWKD